MKIKLSQHIVAFIDILGFSSMVKHDCEKAVLSDSFAEKLYDAHMNAKEIKKNNRSLNIIQFSDSIVISLPYSEDNTKLMLNIVSNYQHDLFNKKLLCRGGISYGKHFIEDDFLFSMGLIDAYHIEKEKAKYPRIVVSKDLLNLLSQKNCTSIKNELLIQESDGEYFIDYFGNREKEKIEETVKEIEKKFNHYESSVRAKYEWLINYFTFSFPNSDVNNIPKWTK